MEDIKYLLDMLYVSNIKANGTLSVSMDDLSSQITYKNINEFSQYLIDNGIKNKVLEICNPFGGFNIEEYLIQFEE